MNKKFTRTETKFIIKTATNEGIVKFWTEQSSFWKNLETVKIFETEEEADLFILSSTNFWSYQLNKQEVYEMWKRAEVAKVEQILMLV